MKEHWIAIRYNQHGFYGPETPHTALGTVKHGDFHFHGGFTHMSMPEGAEIIKDYGLIDDMDEDAITAVFDDYDKLCPTLPHDLERAVSSDVDGYMAPNGDIYRCGYMGHTYLARDLTKQFGIRPLDMPSNGHQEALLQAGWICLMHGVIPYEQPPTEAQVAVLNRLLEMNQSFPHYREGIERFLRHAKRQMERVE
jgi:hypothetical protein